MIFLDEGIPSLPPTGYKVLDEAFAFALTNASGRTFESEGGLVLLILTTVLENIGPDLNNRLTRIENLLPELEKLLHNARETSIRGETHPG